MFANFEALFALHQFGTMSNAAAYLGITQSAISKRIHSLENELGEKLIEPSGRKVSFTSAGIKLLEKAKPHYLELREILADEVSENTGHLSVAISGALLLSWGEKILSQLRKDNPGITISFRSYQSPVAIANVLSGDSAIALVHGEGDRNPHLAVKPIAEEEVVIVPSELKPFALTSKSSISVLTIDSHSETWSVMERRLRRLSSKKGFQIVADTCMQNFASVTQLARAGYAHGLTPIGVPLALGIPMKKLVRFGLFIPISMLGRPSNLQRGLVDQFHRSLCKHVPKP